MQSGQEGQPLEMLGMAEETMVAYSEALLEEQARALAETAGISYEDAFESAEITSMRAALVFASKLIVANNAYLTRHLLELGVIEPGAGLDLQEEHR
jgi:predicted homoserine dehydrogenase-like protein